MKNLSFLVWLLVPIVCSSQVQKKILGKWASNQREFISSDKHKVLRSQKLPYFETYEFKAAGKGIDLTIKNKPVAFTYFISGDTLYMGKLIYTIDSITKSTLVITRLSSLAKKPELRQRFSKMP